jgi:2'-hydroxyisoflavone reductase
MRAMRLLVLGGTRFVGRAIVDEAVRRGYDVTTFTRGLAEPRPGTTTLRGDRTHSGDLHQLGKHDWDAVVDTSVLAPADVAASAEILASHTRHYTYVSSLRVYRDWPARAVDEGSPTHDAAPDAAGEMEYARAKAGSERAVERSFPGRCLLVRAGIIVGPYESPPRLPWWLARIRRGGQVVAPGPPDRPVRAVDVRDLAAWILDNPRRQIPGAVNVPGQAGQTFGTLIDACRKAAAPKDGRAAEVVWVTDDVLRSAGVQPWWQLPMWAPDEPEWAGTWDVTGERAGITAIRYRPLTDTVNDTWRWLRRQSQAAGQDPETFQLEPGTGLDAATEQAVLERLRQS